MTQQVESIYISAKKTYLIRCRDCRARREFHVSELPHTAKPYPYQCACGQTSMIRLISFRCAPRKDVNLKAILVRSTVEGSVRIGGLVENLSVKGMRISVPAIRNFRDQTVKVLMVIPARIRRSLDVKCRVRRMVQKEETLRLALEFLGLTPEQQHALEEYLSA
jgi:PilZ domain